MWHLGLILDVLFWRCKCWGKTTHCLSTVWICLFINNFRAKASYISIIFAPELQLLLFRIFCLLFWRGSPGQAHTGQDADKCNDEHDNDGSKGGRQNNDEDLLLSLLSREAAWATTGGGAVSWSIRWQGLWGGGHWISGSRGTAG